MGTSGHIMVSCLPLFTAAFQHSTCWYYFGACVLRCRRCEAGRKDNPCSSCSHAVGKKPPHSSTKNSFDIFASKSQTQYFETERQTNLEDWLQIKGLQKLLKKGLQSFTSESAGQERDGCNPTVTGTHYRRNPHFSYLIPHIILQTSYLPLDFTFKNYTEHFNSIRGNYFLLFLPVCILTKTFIHLKCLQSYLTDIAALH